jgi:hypothetical protein
MFKKVTVSNKRSKIPYLERLKRAKAIDLRNNSIFIDMGNGYGKVIPKNENIKFQ